MLESIVHLIAHPSILYVNFLLDIKIKEFLEEASVLFADTGDYSDFNTFGFWLVTTKEKVFTDEKG